MTNFHLTDLAQQLPASVPFVGPETQERLSGIPFQARLGANENGFGMAPWVQVALREALECPWMYGDPEAYDLRLALGALHGISASSVMPGEGIDGLLGLLVRLFVGAGDAVVTSQGAYPTFNYHVAGFGGVLHTVPYQGDSEDPEALIAKAREVGAKLIYFANPDNPMGSWHEAPQVQAMIEAVPEGCLLLLDEAYVEFAPEGTSPEIDPADTRVIRLRTFSKAHGMAGMRVGYAMGHPELMSAFNKVRNHFGLGRLAQIAGFAAIAGMDNLERMLTMTEQAKTRIGTIVNAQGLVALPSATNFVAVDCGRDGAFSKSVLQALAEDGVFVRMPFVAPQDRCIRITAGPADEMDILERALPNALAKARAG